METDPRDSKRQKLSHGPFQSGFHERLQSRGKTPTAAVRKKHARPQPPRGRHPPKVRRQRADRSSTGADAKTNIRHSATALSSNSEGNVTALSFAKNLLDKLWVRNKNQHRTQPWWRTLSSLRKGTSRLMALEDEERRLKSESQLLGSHSRGHHVRKRFERESQLRTEKEAWVQWVREVLLPKAYIGFSSLVGDTQFANLGVVLVGVLADIVSVTGAPEPARRSGDRLGGTKITETQNLREVVATGEATSLRVTGPHSGELIERQYDSDDVGEIVERNTSEDDAKERQNIRSDKNKKVTNTPSDGGHSRRAGPTAVIPKIPEEGKPRPPTNRLASAWPHPAVGRMIVPDETVAQGKSETTINGAGRVGKLKQGKARKKHKNAIDDLFAGLT
ncbi:hypothetical protein G647_05126 [Cladophialophora carrionii CBS 160.54]|uniref:RNase MRP protein 1 RNA binding domain-containing protein n=1 Tax=Cladophialophora carrionii CBS 160.54 TaxID=1279043 RepID=V9D9E9_9EURO|nr:uncharacterized protein G647_05126 [Cladophialophora carrionii CBS 160.54]ETI23326.1 hypothetical protein G647_05126 [Cladophialophora carrionii CBS 160.54]